MPLPKPVLGLVVHYGFLWVGPGRSPPGDTGKNRPCVIVDIDEIVEGATSERLVKRVTYLPISHVGPRHAEQAIKVPPRVSQYLGLTEAASYVYVSFAVEDDWPFDVERIPGKADRFDYGLIPPRLFTVIADDYAAYRAKHAGFVFSRKP